MSFWNNIYVRCILGPARAPVLSAQRAQRSTCSALNVLSAQRAQRSTCSTPASLMADNLAHPYNLCRVLTIDNLPDVVLLEIFDFYVVRYPDQPFNQFFEFRAKKEVEWWQSLVHVCQRWRYLIFGSPRRLHLQLCCTTVTTTFSEERDHVWPAYPLLILGGISKESVDNVISRLDSRGHRISQINLNFFLYSTLQIEKLWRAMQVPLPKLEILRLSLGGWSHGPAIPDSFLGGSAPRLRHFFLCSFPFPGLPNLFLSANTCLVELYLVNIPLSGYISPEAMATCLSMLTSLKTFRLEFESPRSHPDPKSRRPFSPTRSVLPTLKIFRFKGVTEYFEDFVARIDAPQLYWLSTAFINVIDFKASELNQFISRTPTLGPYDEACLISRDRDALLRFRQSHPESFDNTRMFEVEISSNWRLEHSTISILAQFCTLSLRLFSTIENLYIYMFLPPFWKEFESKWLDLLLPFTAVKNLYLSKELSPPIALALQEVTGERVTEVLPALKNVLLEGFQPESVQEGIAQFISARQLTIQPVAISAWHRKFHEDYSSRRGLMDDPD